MPPSLWQEKKKKSSDITQGLLEVEMGARVAGKITPGLEPLFPKKICSKAFPVSSSFFQLAAFLQIPPFVWWFMSPGFLLKRSPNLGCFNVPLKIHLDILPLPYHPFLFSFSVDLSSFSQLIVALMFFFFKVRPDTLVLTSISHCPSRLC